MAVSLSLSPILEQLEPKDLQSKVNTLLEKYSLEDILLALYESIDKRAYSQADNKLELSALDAAFDVLDADEEENDDTFYLIY